MSLKSFFYLNVHLQIETSYLFKGKKKLKAAEDPSINGVMFFLLQRLTSFSLSYFDGDLPEEEKIKAEVKSEDEEEEDFTKW